MSAVKERAAAVLAACDKIKEAIYTPVSVLQAECWVTPEPVPFERREEGRHIPSLSAGTPWGQLWDCAWFHFTGDIPAGREGMTPVVLLDLAGEGCIFTHDGKTPVRGITNVSSEFDHSLGMPGKRVVPMALCCHEGKIDFWLEAGCNDLFGRFCDHGQIVEMCAAYCRDDIRKLYYDAAFLANYVVLANGVDTLDNLWKGVDENTLPRTNRDPDRRLQVLDTLYNAVCGVSDFSPAAVAAMDAPLAAELAVKNGDGAMKFNAIGHAHIDLAWLWPLRETKRKGARTFSTALELMERYPNYKFGASQPQLYQWMKDLYPGLYAKIKEKVAEGRWEPQGGLWVECDTNVTGAESLVRQLVYGKRFFRKEFNHEEKMLWLPDVFGYSAAVPQLMKKCGIDYFMTIKMSWNRVNKIPHHTFIWQGLDGSEVLAHMPPEGTYNSAAAPRSLADAEDKFFDRGVSDEALMLFGIGDGGGGPGAEHLERLEREHDFRGLAKVEQGLALDFFHRLEKNRDRYSKWVGELYLERHQGTYTTQANNKKFNRLMELGLRNAEMMSAFAAKLSGFAYPRERFEEIWKEILLYQFHDIIPGSSIKRVYDESVARYRALYQEVTGIAREAMIALLPHITTAGTEKPYIVFNTQPCRRRDWIQLDGRWFRADVPALGWQLIDAARMPDYAFGVKSDSDARTLENALVRVTFGEDGSVLSVFDKKRQAEMLRAPANILQVYTDNADCWEVPDDFAREEHTPFQLVSGSFIEEGPAAIFRAVYTYGNSKLTQDVVVRDGSARIDFVTHVSWYETHKMLRTEFPADIHANEAVCDIQFGSVRRPTHTNTSWDLAKHEVCAHKWVDLSQRDRGLALLNTGKYGHRIWNNTLNINLLRSPMYPGVDADKGEHDFTYALYPHKGDHVTGGVIAEGYALNDPLLPVETKPGVCGEFNFDGAFVRCLSDYRPVIETVKLGFDDDGLVLRVYDAAGCEGDVTLQFAMPVESAALVNMLEDADSEEALPVSRSRVTFHVKPYEVVTLKVR